MMLCATFCRCLLEKRTMAIHTSSVKIWFQLPVNELSPKGDAIVGYGPHTAGFFDREFSPQPNDYLNRMPMCSVTRTAIGWSIRVCTSKRQIGTLLADYPSRNGRSGAHFALLRLDCAFRNILRDASATVEALEYHGYLKSLADRLRTEVAQE